MNLEAYEQYFSKERIPQEECYSDNKKQLEIQRSELNRVINYARWRIDFDETGRNGRVYFSPEAKKLLGIAEGEEGFAPFLRWCEKIHPEDQKDIYANCLGIIDGSYAGDRYEDVYRFPNAQGEYRYYREIGNVVRRPNGTVESLLGLLVDITEQKAKEREEQEKAEILSLLNVASWSAEFSCDGKITSVHWSDEIRHMLGFKNQEDFPDDEAFYNARIHVDDFPRVSKQFYSALADSTIYDCRYRLLHANGEYIWVRSAGRFHRDAMGRAVSLTGIFENVNDSYVKKQKEAQLQKYMRVSHHLGMQYVTIWVLHATSWEMELFQNVGVTALNLLHIDVTDRYVNYEKAMHTYAANCVAMEDRESFLAQVAREHVLAELAKHNVYRVNYIRQWEGVKRYYQVIFMVPEDGEYTGDIINAYRDIDAEVRAEKERQEDLKRAFIMAEHANRAKTAFLNSMSHDIRTPMNAIVGFTSLALKHLDKLDVVKDYLKKISISSKHLLSLINDVLDMSRIESGKVKLDEREVHLPDVFHDIRAIIQGDIKSKNFDFLIDAIDVIDEDVYCDRLKINQILLNLLSNAVKFTEPGGKISVRVTQVAGAQEGYGNYEFRVKDTGIGMSASFQKHIFEPFSRAETATKSGVQGTGLGMAITKNIVDIMGGTISVVSQVGKGSEFIVHLRLRLAHAKKKIEPIKGLEGLKALIADDDMNTCFSITKMLMTIGMHAEWTTSGKEAVARTQFAVEQQDEFDVYIIDWLMPDMNGIETVRRIRQVIGDSKPIIILTAYDWSDVEEEAREAGVTTFCSKPLFLSELREVLAKPFALTQEQQSEEMRKQRDFTGRKVLLVEDNILNQEIAATMLREVGFAVELCDDGDEAVEMLRHVEAGRFDVVLMDIQMPRMDGYTATREIRTLPNVVANSLPIIALTANAFEEDKRTAISAGMNDFITKPIDAEQMVETISKFL